MSQSSPASLQSAGIARRLGSLLYEQLLVAAVLLAASALSTPLMTKAGSSPAAHALNAAYLALVLLGYFGLSWTRSGQTVAMKAWRLELLRRDGSRLDWPAAILRFLCAGILLAVIPLLAYRGLATLVGNVPDRLLLSLLWWALPLGWAWLDPERQFLHDRLAGTRQWHHPRPPRPQ